jgi:hypothetical protein
VPISRRVVLQHYFEKVVNNLPKIENVSREELQQALEKALADYKSDYASVIYKNPIE